jgi:hypothetical protein
MFRRPQFWIWEGVAVHAEGLGDPQGRSAGGERGARLRRRLAWGEHEPLRRLLSLSQDGFEGRHYDQAGSVATWLLEADGGARRQRALALLAHAMGGRAEVEDFERLVGLSPEEAERLWLAWASG